MSGKPDYLSGVLRTSMILAVEDKQKEASAAYPRYIEEATAPRRPTDDPCVDCQCRCLEP